ncbi:iron-sulfur cluster assembly protein [Kribbella aluminosa]|uniref:iron-sulfur cluster assembly protein n=1 Tax=Kribbella aluminosa TaxID=416017 RepID=UPI0031D61733
MHQKQVRVPYQDARAALARVAGDDAVSSVAKLRHGPGVTCEPVARVLDRALTHATQDGLDPHGLVLSAFVVEPGEGIVRVRRKAHGKADWITSVTSDISIALTPRGIYESAVVEDPPDRYAVEPTPRPSSYDASHPLVPEIRERLFEVIDPDLGVNIVDLGFVRNIGVENTTAVITMTLTSAACPLAGVMEDQVRTELLGDDGIVDDFRIDWRWAPAWTPADLSADGREQLRAVGFNI